jgi:hypothetical protein
MLVSTYKTTVSWPGRRNTHHHESFASYILLPMIHRLHLSVYVTNQDNSVNLRGYKLCNWSSIPGRYRHSSFRFHIQANCRMPCISRFKVMTAALLKIGLVAKSLMTHHLQGQASQEKSSWIAWPSRQRHYLLQNTSEYALIDTGWCPPGYTWYSF